MHTLHTCEAGPASPSELVMFSLQCIGSFFPLRQKQCDQCSSDIILDKQFTKPLAKVSRKRITHSQIPSLWRLGGWRVSLAFGLLESSDLEEVSFFSLTTSQSHVGLHVIAKQHCLALLCLSWIPRAMLPARSLCNGLIHPNLASLTFLDNAQVLAASPRWPSFKGCGLSR